jgi:hypothetical protein
MLIDSPIDTPPAMSYTDIVQFFENKSMLQESLIDAITTEMYSNQYEFMETIIEEYVMGLNDKELKTLERTMAARCID